MKTDIFRQCLDIILGDTEYIPVLVANTLFVAKVLHCCRRIDLGIETDNRDRKAVITEGFTRLLYNL